MSTEVDANKYLGDVPEWLNIDLLVPDDIRRDTIAAVERFKAALPSITKELYLASYASREWYERVERGKAEGAGDDVYELIRELCGHEELWEMVQLVEGIAAQITGSTVNDDELKKLENRFLDTCAMPSTTTAACRP